MESWPSCTVLCYLLDVSLHFHLRFPRVHMHFKLLSITNIFCRCLMPKIGLLPITHHSSLSFGLQTFFFKFPPFASNLSVAMNLCNFTTLNSFLK
ncbi:hypothetical protein P9112_007834 [Eukaryota sp. TZLM1-RC]